MRQSLPAPEVVRCYFDDAFEPPLSAMALRWGSGSAELSERLWHLPEDVTVFGPPPRRFGVSIRRFAADSYGVRLLWDSTSLAWKSLSRVQLLGCSLTPLLASMGTDLLGLLDQPIHRPERTLRAVAA
jgi:hypothetical protein